MKFLITSCFCLIITFVDSQTKFKINTDNLSDISEEIKGFKIQNKYAEKTISADNEGYWCLENQDAQDTLDFVLVTDQFIYHFSIPTNALYIDGLNVLDIIELRRYFFCKKYNVILKRTNSGTARPFYVNRVKS
jgi:hypothetical protein